MLTFLIIIYFFRLWFLRLLPFNPVAFESFNFFFDLVFKIFNRALFLFNLLLIYVFEKVNHCGLESLEVNTSFWILHSYLGLFVNLMKLLFIHYWNFKVLQHLYEFPLPQEFGVSESLFNSYV